MLRPPAEVLMVDPDDPGRWDAQGSKKVKLRLDFKGKVLRPESVSRGSRGNSR